MTLFGHLIKLAIRAFFRIAFTGLLFIAIGVGVSLLVAYQAMRVWPPSIPEWIAVGAVGLLLGYAAGLTVLVREAVSGVSTAEHGIVEGVEQAEERVTEA
jgi:hypothetical protein